MKAVLTFYAKLLYEAKISITRITTTGLPHNEVLVEIVGLVMIAILGALPMLLLASLIVATVSHV